MTNDMAAEDLAERTRSLHGIYEDQKDMPLKVASIDVRGLDKTVPHIVQREAEALREITTLQELVAKSEELEEILMGMGIFRSQCVKLHEPSLGAERTCDVEVRVQEKNTIFGHAGAHAQGLHGVVTIDGGVQNIFGHGERIAASCSYDQDTSSGKASNSEASLSLRKPRIKGTSVDFETSIDKSLSDRRVASSFVEQRTGALTKLSWQSHDYRWSHEVSYDLARLRLQPPGGHLMGGLLAAVGFGETPLKLGEVRPRPSFAVGEQLGVFLKSALKYQLVARDQDPENERNNYVSRSAVEVAAWPGQNALRHWKIEQRFDGNWSPSEQSVFSFGLSSQVGLLRPLGAQQSTFITSRFSAGGVPSGFRGFKELSVGAFAPRPAATNGADGGQVGRKDDYLGGDFLTMTGLYARLHLDRAFPHSVKLPLQLQAFASAGKNVLLPTSQSLDSMLRDTMSGDVRSIGKQLSENLNYSVGSALVLPIQPGINLELGYAFTNRKAKNWYDRVYFGINMSL